MKTTIVMRNVEQGLARRHKGAVKRLFGLPGLALVCLACGSARADDLFWDANGASGGTGGTGTWDTTSLLWRLDSSTGTLQNYSNTADSGTATLGGTAGTVTIASGLTINANRINATSNGYTIAGADATAVLNLDGATPTIRLTSTGLTISANITSAGGISYAATTNSAALTLSGSNSFTSFSGSSSATNSIYILENDRAFGSGDVNFTGNTISLRSTADRNLGNNLSFSGNAFFGLSPNYLGNLTFGTWTRLGTNNVDLTFNNTTTFSGFSSAGGTLRKLGTGNMIVNGNYSHGGAATLTGGGVLAISGSYAQGSHGMLISGGSQLGLSNTGLGGALTADLGTNNSVKWGTGSSGLFAYGSNATWGHSANNLTVAFGGTTAPTALTWNGDGSGGFVVSGQTLILGNALSNGTVDFRNAIDLNSATQTVQVNKGDTNTGGGVDAVLSGSLSNGALTKDGNGVLAVTAANTYGLGTAVNAGTLLVNNTAGSGLGTGNVAVNGGTLGGSGLFTGDVLVGAGGVLSPGNSIESLGAGSIGFEGGTYAFELNTSTVTADLLYGGDGSTLTLTSSPVLALSDLGSGAPLALGTKFTLISYDGAWNGGTFAGYADGSTFSFAGNLWMIAYNDTTAGVNFAPDAKLNGTSFVTLTTVIPEPGASVLVGLGLGLVVFRLRRRLT